MPSVPQLPLPQPRPLLVAPPALAARYRVLFTPLDARCPAPPAMEWLYLRDARQVRQVRGSTERIWTLAPSGALGFEQNLDGARHPAEPWLTEHGAGPYRHGDWQLLNSFIDAEDLSALQADPVQPRAPGCEGYTLPGEGLVDLLWDAARQLPLRMTLVRAAGTLSHTLLSVEAQR